MATFAEPQVHLWTRDEYYKMAEVGLFDQKRVELIEGRVIEMSPMGSVHATVVTLTARPAERAFGPAYFVRWQMPFTVSDLSEPEPDVAVIQGNVREYTIAHPTTAALIVEVAETSLTYDRIEKNSLYARAGIADYWIVNLVNEQVEVYRDPQPDPEAIYGFSYATMLTLTRGDTIAPLAEAAVEIMIADLLP
ncbi:MAG TPA: Uma2 family endonuclease [Herpetosiphonaceae bacterium]